MLYSGFKVPDEKTVEIDVEEIVKETAAAFLCRIEGEPEEQWLPKSQVIDAEQYSEGECDLEMTITKWIAKEKGLW